MGRFIRINANDNIVVAISAVDKGFQVTTPKFKVLQGVMAGHKVAAQDIKKGESVIKYGHPIGHAICDISQGELVHTHNLKTNLSDIIQYEYQPRLNDIEKNNTGNFQGFKRPDGSVGIRNDIWIIPTVGCVNSVALCVAEKAKHFLKGSVSNVIAFTHPYGCSQMGEDQENTKKILANLANHPNAGGVLLLGLGCENCAIDTIKSLLGDFDDQKIKFLVSQDVQDEIEASLSIIKELIDYASTFERETISLDKLIVGMKCGGSDGLSGITANPTVGEFSDLLIAMGGSTILTEVPEMFGAETLLMDRCRDEKTFEKTVKLINDFKEYFTRHDQVIYENPSPGNKAGGISTLEDKSLGCTQKSGTGNVVDVLDYGETLREPGLNLLCSPGNDLVAATALAASGAQLVLFTTGRGTPFACPVPTVKISSNTDLFTRKNNWIDFDTGAVVDGVEIKDMGTLLMEKVVSVSSGELVKSEQNGYYDMAIFKQGVTL